MRSQDKPLNAVAAIRVSTTRQGVQGDSPEAQKEQIERFATQRGIQLKQVFLFLESASKEEQPLQLAIDYCANSRHKVDLFIIKSIDRFTRGGFYVYSDLKRQLVACNTQLVDIYGVISTQKINTLEHLGISYEWSVYSPTKNSELLEAERASDEKRDIMSRMIGAEIRYARMGYWMRKPPIGFTTEKVETMNGTRSILLPHPKESDWIISMFELRAQGVLTSLEIVDYVNKLGFRSRVSLKRDKKNRMRVVGRQGGSKLTVKALYKYLQNPIYAGMICEKWTEKKPIKAKFKGLVPIETFNKANAGSRVIARTDSGLEFQEAAGRPKQLMKPKNSTYPFSKVVTCSKCGESFIGSASRGKNGKHYPAYQNIL